MTNPKNVCVGGYLKDGCPCPGDMAVRMRKVLTRPWVGVECVTCLYCYLKEGRLPGFGPSA